MLTVYLQEFLNTQNTVLLGFEIQPKLKVKK